MDTPTSGCYNDGMTSSDNRPQVGIPYGRATFTAAGDPATECAACHALIVERTDTDGERLTNNYAAHYEKEHAR